MSVSELDSQPIQDGPEDQNKPAPVTDAGLTLSQFEAFHKECKEQPPWRTKADKEADYLDGNQLDSDILRKQQEIGLPPAIEPLMGPALAYVCGMEKKMRRNWRVVPNSDTSVQEVADALNVRLNETERHAKADKACSNAFRYQAGVGVGWVEVTRNPNPFQYRYRATSVHRNEIWYDWKGTTDPSMHDHRYFIRRRWTDKHQASLMFPDKKELIDAASTNWTSFNEWSHDGGHSTGLQMSSGAIMPSYGAVTTPLPGDTRSSYPMLSTAYQSERGSSIEEQEWRDTSHNRVALFEVWYRVWERVLILRTPDGRAVEYDATNAVHVMAIAQNVAQPEYSVVSKVRLAWWLGPHKLSDEPSPYAHNRIPYVPFWHHREDRTGVPYGLARGWMYLQDTVNATMSKLRWGLSAVRTIRTEGATVDDDNTVRREVARSDADIVLSKNYTKDGHVFKVERDFQLTDQQNTMLKDSREGINRVGAMNSAYKGEENQARSGFANSSLVDQAQLGQTDLFDNFQESRTEVGELLMSLIIEDIGDTETQVALKGDVLNAPRTITLNSASVHPETGAKTLTNDLQRTMLKVVLEDVPASPSFRSQQLQSFSEAFKSAPDEFQRVLFPHMLSLMDVPDRQAVIDAVRQLLQAPTEDQIQQRVDQAVDEALQKADTQLAQAKQATEDQIAKAKIRNLDANTVATGTTAAFEAMQAAGVVINAPGAAPVADEILKGAGYTPPGPAAVNPGYGITPPVPEVVPPPGPGTTVPTPAEATHPNLPTPPASPAVGAARGIETQRNEGV